MPQPGVFLPFFPSLKPNEKVCFWISHTSLALNINYFWVRHTNVGTAKPNVGMCVVFDLPPMQILKQMLDVCITHQLVACRVCDYGEEEEEEGIFWLYPAQISSWVLPGSDGWPEHLYILLAMWVLGITWLCHGFGEQPCAFPPCSHAELPWVHLGAYVLVFIIFSPGCRIL